MTSTGLSMSNVFISIIQKKGGIDIKIHGGISKQAHLHHAESL